MTCIPRSCNLPSFKIPGSHELPVSRNCRYAGYQGIKNPQCLGYREFKSPGVRDTRESPTPDVRDTEEMFLECSLFFLNFKPLIQPLKQQSTKSMIDLFNHRPFYITIQRGIYPSTVKMFIAHHFRDR